MPGRPKVETVVATRVHVRADELISRVGKTIESRLQFEGLTPA